MNARLHQTRRPRAHRRGFTLIEVLLVAGIIVMLAAIVVPNLLGADEAAKIKATRANVTNLAKMFDVYKFTYDQEYPTGSEGFSVLVNGPGNLPSFKPVHDNPHPVDAWNRAIHYQYPGTHNKMGKPDVWSDGPNGQAGDADDINSWTNAGS